MPIYLLFKFVNMCKKLKSELPLLKNANSISTSGFTKTHCKRYKEIFKNDYLNCKLLSLFSKIG